MRKQASTDDYELREEYDFSRMTIVPKGRFAPRQRAGSNLVVLAPDVQQAFPTDQAVNDTLRLVLRLSEATRANLQRGQTRKRSVAGVRAGKVQGRAVRPR